MRMYLELPHDETDEQYERRSEQFEKWVDACYAACVASRPKKRTLTPEQLRKAHQRGGRKQPKSGKVRGGENQPLEAKRQGGLASAAKRWGLTPAPAPPEATRAPEEGRFLPREALDCMAARDFLLSRDGTAPAEAIATFLAWDVARVEKLLAKLPDPE